MLMSRVVAALSVAPFLGFGAVLRPPDQTLQARLFERSIGGLLLNDSVGSLLVDNESVLPWTSDGEVQRVLIVDVRGPTRGTGDGVRIMGMLMDLQTCGYSVEVLSDAKDYEDLKKGWNFDLAKEHFSHVHFWKASQRTKMNLTSFDRIIVGGKLDLLYDGPQAGNCVLPVLNELYEKRKEMRSKVVAFWDDVPFERCLIKPEAKEICPKVPQLVRQMAESSHKFFVLSVDDKNRMLDDMQKNGIPAENIEVRVWPMSIFQMHSAIPSLRFAGASSSRTMVTMMGNFHAVNKMMVSTLFESGAIGTICTAIAERSSLVRIVFMGGLSVFAEEARHAHPQNTSCVDIRSGFVSDQELERTVFPKTRAVLNPFFEDVNSGISVKNFESIMSGVPFITSKYGMHGLSDEVPACGNFPMPDAPGDRHAFANFFINNVVDGDGYAKFASAFAENSPKCMQGQRDAYPTSHLC